MSRNIDFDKPLSEDDKSFLRQRGQGYLVDQQDRVEAARLYDAEGKPDDRPDFRGVSREIAEGIDSDEEPRPVAEDEESDDGDYSDMTVAELKEELEARELPVSGTKAELIARLTEDDSSTEE